MYTANFTKDEWLVVKPNRARPSRISVAAHEGQVDIYDAPLTAETEANAYLIAASPDLYAACQMALQFVECVYREHGRDYLPNAGDAMEQVQAALTKARGEDVSL